MKTLIRADGSQKIGGGHIMRCLTLADELANRGWNCSFAARAASATTVPLLTSSRHRLFELEGTPKDEPQEMRNLVGSCDLLIVDHYGWDVESERSCRPWAGKILVIDDLANRMHDCDFILDQTFGRQSGDYDGLVPTHAKRLMGTDYALLRHSFQRRRMEALERRKNTDTVERILVSLGASDPHRVTAKVLHAISLSAIDVEVDVVTGNADPGELGLSDIGTELPRPPTYHGFDSDMSELMVNADLAIGAAGTMSWERCCLGLPTLMIVTADNQELIARALDRAGASVIAGHAGRLDLGAIGELICEYARDGAKRQTMVENAARICDGSGVVKIAQILTPDEAD